MKRFLIFLASFVLLCPITRAGDIKAIKTNESFQEVARIDRLEQIKINTVPRTTYTPKNLRSQYLMSFQGRDSSNTSVYWSNTFTDYDTKIVGSELKDNKYYIYDNTGTSFLTGERVDLNPINRRLDRFTQDMNGLSNRMDSMERNMYSGLATVTALTSLHPNPRSTAPVELSLGTGIFRDQCAGAVGLFAHPSDNFMIQGGTAFGNNNDWAGYVGITLGLGKTKSKR